jgi:hypothetical protein
LCTRQVGDISKKGWSTVAGGNYTGGYQDSNHFSNGNGSEESGGYQRSNSSGKLGGRGTGDDWQWQDNNENGNNTKS